MPLSRPPGLESGDTIWAAGSVTLPQLAGRVKALIADLTAHGRIGA